MDALRKASSDLHAQFSSFLSKAGEAATAPLMAAIPAPPRASTAFMAAVGTPPPSPPSVVAVADRGFTA